MNQVVELLGITRAHNCFLFNFRLGMRPNRTLFSRIFKKDIYKFKERIKSQGYPPPRVGRHLLEFLANLLLQLQLQPIGVAEGCIPLLVCDLLKV